MNLHDQIMNLSGDCPHPLDNIEHVSAWSQGHRDARHAAAELSLAADAEIDRLRAENARLLSAGAQLANVAFNWSQASNSVGGKLSGEDRGMLKRLQLQWDAALKDKP